MLYLSVQGSRVSGIPIDADLQDPPELIPKLMEKWKDGYDVVYATRELREGEGWFKRGTSFLFYRVIAKLVDINIPNIPVLASLHSVCADCKK